MKPIMTFVKETGRLIFQGDSIKVYALSTNSEAWRSLYLAVFVTGIKSIFLYTNEGLYL